MMRSLSTSALGQPSETKLSLGARDTSAAGFRSFMGEGLPEGGRGGKGPVNERGTACNHCDMMRLPCSQEPASTPPYLEVASGSIPLLLIGRASCRERV